MNNFLKNYWAALIPIIVLVIALLFMFRKDDDVHLSVGMVEADFVDVAAELPGRLDSLYVSEGDTVHQGQVIGMLRGTEINALKEQAAAAIDAAKAQLSLLQNGTRPELVKSAENIYKLSQDQNTLFQQTNDRIQRLYNSGAVSGEERDIVFFKYQAAKKEMETAKLNLQMLQNGARPELLESAKAVVRQAEEAYNLTKALSENTQIQAPADGTVSNLVTHRGEIVAIGYPMMTIQKKNTVHVLFNIRQDKIKSFALNTPIKLTIPGCEPEQIDACVTEISPALEFANWVPVKEKGKFELRTFSVKCTPLAEATIKNLHTGMTASMQLP